VAANNAAVATYAMDDRRDFADADRGFLAPFTEPIVAADGRVLFDEGDYEWIRDDAPAPDTVEPSLWRQSQLLRRGGLYQLSDSIYQVRNSETANLSVIEGRDGLVIVDCMSGVETARQAMGMIREHVSDKPIAAIIYTHTHADHFGGVKGIVSAEDVASGRVPVIAPGHQFERYALGENLMTGNAVARRASYAFGSLLDHGPTGFVTCGIGINFRLDRGVSYVSPTDLITETGTRRTLAGLEFEFLYAPDTEAPEELHLWIPELQALSCAENANHALHNIQTLRGARTRDAGNFARYLDETLERWGEQVEVHFGPHTWPTWENERIVEFIGRQRDAYKYIHDQALRLANKGYTPLEAAERIELPEDLAQAWENRGYHGTVHHNVRAVFTKELGLWDGDPVSLHPHPPAASAQRYVDFIGADAIVAEGRRAFDAADYRWAVEVLHTLVFAQPDHREARELQADAYEQMGYQAEGPQWRGIFLTAARELRDGVIPLPPTNPSSDTMTAVPIGLLFDVVAIRLKGPEAASVDLHIDFEFTDHGETWQMWVARGVLHARRGGSHRATLTVAGSKLALAGVLFQPARAVELARLGQITLDGDEFALDELGRLVDTFDRDFNVVVP
jgi:alkyl sulfatase BDS1-like metallo-beta-lactamase superfamily hydrolase